MPPNRLRFRAFTVLEMMVGLALTALLFIAGFYAYKLVRTYYLQQQQTLEVLTEYRNFEALLTASVHDADGLTYRPPAELRAVLDSFERTFAFREERVLLLDSRRPFTVDTFAVRTADLRIFPEGNPAAVERVSLSLLPFGDPVSVQLRKRYSVAQQLSHED